MSTFWKRSALSLPQSGKAAKPVYTLYAWLSLRACLLTLTLVLLGPVPACRTAGAIEPAVTAVPVRALQIEAPLRIKAGLPLTVLVHVTPRNATSTILLTAQGTFGLLPQQQTPVQGTAHFSFMLLHTQFAGAVQLRASADQVVTTTAVTITPGPAVDPVLPLVGPGSIGTGGEQWTTAITTPRDALDNPVAENTEVIYHIQHPVPPDQAPAVGVETLTTHTQHLLAWARIYSRNRAGPTLIAATADFGHSPERVVIETPGLPVPFRLTADQVVAPADGRHLIRIESDQITDRFGNVLLDGTKVMLVTLLPQDRRSLPAVTIDGRIYTTLQAPSQPGTMVVQAWIAGVASQPLALTFTPGPAVQPIRVVTQPVAGGIAVVAGPLLGQLGQFVPDGAAVSFTITAPDGAVETLVAPAAYGYAEILVRRPTLLPGVYTVAVAAGTGQGALSFDAPVAPE